MAGGVRVRLLIEHYDPNMTPGAGTELLERMHEVAEAHFPGATLQGYVEVNPPDDEVEGLNRVTDACAREFHMSPESGDGQGSN